MQWQVAKSVQRNVSKIHKGEEIHRDLIDCRKLLL